MSSQTPLDPKQTATFRYSRSLSIFMFVVFFGCLLLSATLIPSRGIKHALPWFVALPSALLPLVFSGFVLRSALRFRQSIEVNDSGISLVSGSKKTNIAWDHLAEVRADDVGQRLILEDRSGESIITVEYQITGFAKLRGMIAARFQQPAAAVGTVFRRTRINKIILAFAVIASAFFAIVAWTQHFVPGAMAFAGIAAVAGVAVVLDPSTVRATEDGIEISSPARKVLVRFEDISQILQQEIAMRRNVWAAVVIERKTARPIRLFRFEEGSLAVYSALEKALSDHRRAR